ncbi:NAD(P)/FAD-dependent oxidoreductase [Mycoplasmopsis iners]|uniref:NAD(P)/FAD-dependent oxidoreductase n=1 Tax=Mycoplasmopsis iners TaxID=76630 RepID=UPI0004968C6A|nr:FAD-dependent oxidoreductase [Mycoplasmopsis iners]
MSTKYDVIIIGAGPGGLNAALYTSRANLKVALVEKGAPGGKMTATSKIENWLGFDIIDGFDLALKAYNHAISFGAEHVFGEVNKIEKSGELFIVSLASGDQLTSKKVIIATGMLNREPNFIENYQKYVNRGISYCATCDGPLYKGQNVLVLGGGNSAVEESAYLARIASKVYLVVRDNHFIAEPRLVDDLKKLPNVEIFMEHQIKQLQGENGIEKAQIIDLKNNELKEVEVKAFFPFIGFIPNNSSFKHLNITDQAGFIITDDHMQTSIEGLYAIGDIRKKTVRQIVTAASDGAIAAKHIADTI